MLLFRYTQTAFQLKYFHTVNLPAINVKAKGRPDSMPTLVSAGSGVDIQKVFRRVIHYFQDMGVPADEDIRAVLPDQVLRLRIIVPG